MSTLILHRAGGSGSAAAAPAAGESHGIAGKAVAPTYAPVTDERTSDELIPVGSNQKTFWLVESLRDGHRQQGNPRVDGRTDRLKDDPFISIYGLRR